MRVRRLVAVAATLAVLPLVASCGEEWDQPIGNTNNHISPGPPLPSVQDQDDQGELGQDTTQDDDAS